MKKTHQNVLFLLILISASCTAILILFGQNPRSYYDDITANPYDVRIINGFSNNSSVPLVVWCASHDAGDIGGRALQERDDYSWTVEVAGVYFWSSARFVCTVKWDGTRRKFDAFDADRDRARCGARRLCMWLVKEDGFYFSNDGVNWIKDFPWE